MAFWLFGLLALAVSGIVAALTLHVCVAVAVAMTSPSKSLPAGALVGCGPWIGATALSAGLCMVLYGRFGFAALGFAPAGVIVVSIMEAIRLRTSGGLEVRRDFRVEEGRVISEKTGAAMEVDRASTGSDYLATGPAQGYMVYRVELFRGEAGVAVNTYLEKGEWDAAARELEKACSIPVKRVSV